MKCLIDILMSGPFTSTTKCRHTTTMSRNKKMLIKKKKNFKTPVQLCKYSVQNVSQNVLMSIFEELKTITTQQCEKKKQTL